MFRMPRVAKRLPSPAARPTWALERSLWSAGYSPVAGIDEAGRGALAGPVVAAAVILPWGEYPYRDSKTLKAPLRAELAGRIKRGAVAWAVAGASAAEVDRLDVLGATHLAAQRALAALALVPVGLVTDYLRLAWSGAVLPVAKADSLSPQVAAASILAKTERDAQMVRWHQTYPAYGFASNKGYGVREHLDGLDRHGPCPLHRKSFRPVAQPRLFPR